VRILVTGAFGNVGGFAVRDLVLRGHEVRCFDLPSRANKLSAARMRRWAVRFGGRVEVAWGDLRNPQDVVSAVTGQEAIAHLAGVIPPASEARPEWAGKINVGGMRSLIAAATRQPIPPRLVFASSVSVFGRAQNLPPPRVATDPVEPSDNYTEHKIQCENMLLASGLEWTILRFGAIPALQLKVLDALTLRTMFEVPLDTRIELIHPADAGLAVANAVLSPKVWGRILLIGGGASCQLYQRVYVGRLLDAAGIGRFPDAAYGHTPFYTDWMDTVESEALLSYQRHTAEDFTRAMSVALGFRRHLARLFRPIVRSWILRFSPYWDRRQPLRRRRPRLA
jgi:nucleoside-diphosphate-sugar epimerase